MRDENLNVFGKPLIVCSLDPLTGFRRDSCCTFDLTDSGKHIVCIVATAGFLEFSRAKGNDLTTPRPEYQFPGLLPGDRWCICALRWKEAYLAGYAPQVVLEACHKSILDLVPFEWLLEFKKTE